MSKSFSLIEIDILSLMDHGRDNGFYGDDQGGRLPNFPNSQTIFPLNSPSLYTPTPQLAPPNSFVWNQSHQNSKNHNQTFFHSNTFGEFSSSSGGIGMPSLAIDQRSGVDNMFLDGKHCSTLEELRNHPNIDFTNQVMINRSNHIADCGTNASRNHTKRLWTAEEDNKLNALVSVFGTKNWATISDFMDGRAGKQCRERWNNNLRPNIKSDVWTEEEERILIEAHEKRGNKWSQIAKLLPGRTENAIKNHWNAATRKKTMRLNRNKRYEPDNAKPKSTLLRDYFYIRGMSSTSTTTTTTTTTTNTTNSNNVTIGEFSTIPQDEPQTLFSSDPSSIDLIPTYDEEFNFMMKNLLSTTNQQMVQVLEPQLQTNMNPQGFVGNVEHGTSSSSILSNNYQTTTQFFSEAYFSSPMSEPATFSKSGEPVYDYGDMNMEYSFNAKGGGFSSL